MLGKYSFLGKIHLIASFIYTKIFHPKARLVRLPFDIRNSKFIQIGKGFTSGRNCRIESFPEDMNQKTPNLIIGNNVQINDYVHISARQKVIIGDNSLLASKIFISDLSHGSYDLLNSDSPETIPSERALHSKEIIIGKNVWIGESVCVLSGVTIGDGSIIGALSVVSKSIPSNSIAVGSPAIVIKKFNFKENIWERV
jgi:acetyltransferase-like isoleucine patch superfamily enzyme